MNDTSQVISDNNNNNNNLEENENFSFFDWLRKIYRQNKKKITIALVALIVSIIGIILAQYSSNESQRVIQNLKKNIEKSNLFYVNSLKQIQLPDSLENYEDIKRIRRIQNLCMLINEKCEILFSEDLKSNNDSLYLHFFINNVKIVEDARDLGQEMIPFIEKYGDDITMSMTIHKSFSEKNNSMNLLLRECNNKLDDVLLQNISEKDKKKKKIKVLSDMINDKRFKEYYDCFQQYREHALSSCYQALLKTKSRL